MLCIHFWYASQLPLMTFLEKMISFWPFLFAALIFFLSPYVY